jgi:transposase
MRAVKQVVAGENPETVIKALGFTRCWIYNWISKYKKGGWCALKAVVLPGAHLYKQEATSKVS